MPDLDVQIRAYVDAASKPLTVDDVLGTPSVNGDSPAVTPAVGLLEDRLGPEPTVPDRAEPDERGDDLTVDYLPQARERMIRSERQGWAGLVMAVAATVLVVGGVVVVGGGNSGDSATDPASTPVTDDSSLLPSVDDPVATPSATVPPYTAQDVTALGGVRGITDGGNGLSPEPEVTTPSSCADETVAGQVAVIERPTGWLQVCDEATFDGAVMYDVVAAGPGLVAVGGENRGCCAIDATYYDYGEFEADGVSLIADAVVWTSADGLTWSRVPHDDAAFGGPGVQQMVSVTVGDPGLVAVGRDGTDADGDAAVWISADGSSWSRVPHDEEILGGEGMQRMLSVTAGGPGLVAVGTDGHQPVVPPFVEGRWDGDYTFDEMAVDAAVWTSADGLSWSRIPHDEEIFGGPGHQRMDGVTAGGPGLVAVGSANHEFEPGEFGPLAAVWTSPDGLTWSRIPDDADLLTSTWGIGVMLSVTSGGPGLVAVGATGGPGSQIWQEAVWTSPDGFSWSEQSTWDAWYERMSSVTVGGPGLVAVGTMADAGAAVWVTDLDGGDHDDP